MKAFIAEFLTRRFASEHPPACDATGASQGSFRRGVVDEVLGFKACNNTPPGRQ